MNQFQITSRPRHIRYVFFVDEQYPYEKLFSLICSNQRIWGGRYNPIIPVIENVIPEKYLSLLKYYDPDYVFYSNEIDPEIIKRIRLFNPCGYYNLDDQPRMEDITGIDAFYLLSQYDTNSKIILTQELWKTKNPLLDFYKLNFGIDSDSTVLDYEIGKYYSQIIIDFKNLDSLNQILHQKKPVIKNGLSRLNLNTPILRTLQHAQNNDFEIVVAKDKSSITDILYYWNRLLYVGKNIIYISIEELNLLSADKFFGGVLYDLSSEDIQVVSMTLNKEEIDELIINKLNPIAFNRRFQYKDIHDFPFEILDAHGLYERDYGESSTTQTLISDKGLFHLPKLSFTNKVGFYPQKWAVDIEIKKSGDYYQNQIEFPYTTKTQYIVKGVNGRINKSRHLSVFIHNQQNTSDTLEITIPEIKDLLRQLICQPVINGVTQNTKFVDIGPHDDSKKLSAFLKSFNFDFSTIDDFFTDKFWVDLFEDLVKNERIAGDTIQFDEIKSKCIATLKMKGIELGKKGETYKNEENLELGLKRTIKELCNYRVFLKGFNLKCNKCSSAFWYPLQEVRETVNCKGCLEDFELPIEPKFSYKLNDLIRNNIFQSKTIRNGNLTVIRTLVSLHNRSQLSFQYSPQINLYDNNSTNAPCAEIDIVCLSNGELIIGEAKHSSPGFFEKNDNGLNSLDHLVAISKVIFPDKIILSCYEDQKNKLNKAQKTLEGKFLQYDYKPEIEALLLSQPDDLYLGGYRYFHY